MPTTRGGTLEKSIERERQAFLRAKTLLREKERKLTAPRQPEMSTQYHTSGRSTPTQHIQPHRYDSSRCTPRNTATHVTNQQNQQHQQQQQQQQQQKHRSRPKSSSRNGERIHQRQIFNQSSSAGITNESRETERINDNSTTNNINNKSTTKENNLDHGKQLKELQRQLEQESHRAAVAVSRARDLERDVDLKLSLSTRYLKLLEMEKNKNEALQRQCEVHAKQDRQDTKTHKMNDKNENILHTLHAELEQSTEHVRTLEITCIALRARAKSAEQHNHNIQERFEELEQQLYSAQNEVDRLKNRRYAQDADTQKLSGAASALQEVTQQKQMLESDVSMWRRKHAVAEARARELAKDRDALAFQNLKADKHVVQVSSELKRQREMARKASDVTGREFQQEHARSVVLEEKNQRLLNSVQSMRGRMGNASGSVNSDIVGGRGGYARSRSSSHINTFNGFIRTEQSNDDNNKPAAPPRFEKQQQRVEKKRYVDAWDPLIASTEETERADALADRNNMNDHKSEEGGEEEKHISNGREETTGTVAAPSWLEEEEEDDDCLQPPLPSEAESSAIEALLAQAHTSINIGEGGEDRRTIGEKQTVEKNYKISINNNRNNNSDDDMERHTGSSLRVDVSNDYAGIEGTTTGVLPGLSRLQALNELLQ